ncbi:MAG: TetR/AcrR family transcriptional regulator, partial [Candidatus Azotimanducaceae bacterium]
STKNSLKKPSAKSTKKAHATGPRAQKVELVRQRVLAAAQEEFALHGYQGTRMQSIADRAELPKANVHYYFTNKSSLYLAVLDDIAGRWNNFFSDFNRDDDPAILLDEFVREKIQFSFNEPSASRLFANEIIQGAPQLANHIKQEIRPYVLARAGTIAQWVEEGKMAAVEPMQLIFLIWSVTQHYADFQAQVLLVSNQHTYSKKFIQQTSDFLSTFILRGCGLAPPTPSDYAQILHEQ